MSDDDHDTLKQTIGAASNRLPIEPRELGPDDEIQFDCHKGVSCFNECCKSIDVTLTPYDILRLSRRLGMSTTQFLEEHTRPFHMDDQGTPGVKLYPGQHTRTCRFVSEEGCTVYEDRPAACRYYALGSMGVRRQGSSQIDNVYVLVKESHCQGHNEPRRVTVRQYREEQGCDQYDRMNEEWRELLLRNRSVDSEDVQPTERAQALFYMASYDLDRFRRFALSEQFHATLQVDAKTRRAIAEDDEALLEFAMRFLRQALYGEKTIPERAGAHQRRQRVRQKGEGQR